VAAAGASDLPGGDDPEPWLHLLGPFVETVGPLALTTRSGHVVYPSFQFSAGRPLPGLDRVLAELPEAIASPWLVAVWLVTPARELADRAPIALLGTGAPHEVDDVIGAARRWATALRS
jgi:hypothetical protein